MAKYSKNQYAGFSVVGKVVGTNGKDFYKEGKTKSGKDSYSVRFALAPDKEGNGRVYVECTGYSGIDIMYMSKDRDANNPIKYCKTLTEAQAFEKSKEYADGKYFMSNGISVKFEGMENATVVPKPMAIKMMADKLQEGQSFRVMGKIEYNPSINKEGNLVTYKKLEIEKIYISNVDVQSEEHELESAFKQKFVFEEISKANVEKNETPYFEMSGKFIIENKDGIKVGKNTFRVYNDKLALAIRKNIKPFTEMEIAGNIISKLLESEPVQADEWGEVPTAYQTYAKTENYFEVTFANKESFDTEKFNEKELNDWVKNQNVYGKTTEQKEKEVASDDFGIDNKSVASDDDDDFWN